MEAVRRGRRRGAVLDRVKTAARRRGIDVRRWRPPEARRSRLLAERHVDLVLDVGANAGQYGQSLRESGYRARIVSFEPLSAAYEALEARAGYDPLWECQRLGLGNVDGSAEMNVAGNSASSSLLPMRERHVQALPRSAYVGTETVPLSRLDSLSLNLAATANTMLKLDVQGYEQAVLEGAQQSLRHVGIVETELSLVELYEGQPLLREMVNCLYGLGYDLTSLEPGFHDPATGRILQFDGVFLRRDDLKEVVP
jgi:FkbM family methyltransferase